MTPRPSIIPQTWKAALVNRLAQWAGVKTAKLSQFQAGTPSRTRGQSSYIGTNPNSWIAQIERVRMQFNGEYMMKNVPFASAYSAARWMYCRPTGWVPNTGDAVLDSEVVDYLDWAFESAGTNCTMDQLLRRTLDYDIPARGDGGLILYRDVEARRFRWIQFSADQLGELFYFGSPANFTNGLTYFAGIFLKPNGQHAGFKIYERGSSMVYTNPEFYAAEDVIFIRNGPFGGVRGITEFYSALLSIEKSDRLFQSAMDAAQKQASREGFVFNERGQPDEGTYETDTYADGQVTYFQRAMDGTTTEYMFKGDSYEAMDPTMPGAELIAGVEAAKEEACLALGFPYSFLVNATKVGGAPSRLEINKASKQIEWLREERLPALNRIAYITIMDGVDRKDLPPHPLIERGRWQFPNLPTADAFRDEKSDILSIRAGIESPQRVCARYGDNFKEILAENAQAAIQSAMAVEDANRTLVKAGYKPTITAIDVRQMTDNPQQAATAESIDLTGKAPQTKAPAAKMAGTRDVSDERRDEGGEWTTGGDGGSGADDKKKMKA